MEYFEKIDNPVLETLIEIFSQIFRSRVARKAAEELSGEGVGVGTRYERPRGRAVHVGQAAVVELARELRGVGRLGRLLPVHQAARARLAVLDRRGRGLHAQRQELLLGLGQLLLAFVVLLLQFVEL